MKTLNFDYIIIGSGIAGLSAAKELSPKHKICIITKGKHQESSTHYAQGGIAAVFNKEVDTPLLHYEDTLKAGDGLCDKKNVKILVEEGPKLVRELINLGINFDKSKNGFDLTQEGAHSQRRILHASDSTGKEIEKGLYNVLKNHKNVTFYENTAIIKLITEKKTCLGCLAVSTKNQPILFLGKGVILATGGAGQIYSYNTNPPITTGDGMALAFNAGCDMQDMEFIQFHPTTLYTGDKKPISIFLISEAVRGEGGILRNIHGKRFMQKFHPDAELAPRDIVARSIISEMKKTKTNHVYLDLTGLKINIKKRFPTIHKRCLEAKIDITKDFIPVAPAAHYFMGGVKTDCWGKTTVKNLYAAGEVASLGIHGANRLASNSLLDGLVFGYRVAKDIIKEKKSLPKITKTSLELYKKKSPSINYAGYSQILAIKQEIKDIMWKNVGIIRTEKGLNQAILKLKKFVWILNLTTLKKDIIEVQNMLIVANLVTHFALLRKESRGAHFRQDYPEKNDKIYKKHQVLNKKSLTF